MRIGHGYDVHAFAASQGKVAHIVIGGVSIPHDRAIIAHSDGDVLIHALCDALLGAAALGDIGQHFPDSDPAYKGIDSRTLLRKVIALLTEKGYTFVNGDISIIAQAPKMAPHIDAMRTHLASDLNCQKEQINIKATTTEKLGFTGRGEGIACEAVVLISSHQ